MHHASCYRNYTLILYRHENPVAEKHDTVFDKAYNVAKVVLQDLVRNKDFIEYVKVTERYQEVLVKESSCSHTEIIQYKKNLKRKIEVDFPEMNFLKLQNDRLLIYLCFYHVTYAFQSESTLYSCLNVKELLARSRREI